MNKIPFKSSQNIHNEAMTAISNVGVGGLSSEFINLDVEFETVSVYFDAEMNARNHTQVLPFTITDSGIHNAVKCVFWLGHCYDCVAKVDHDNHVGVFLTNGKPTKSKDTDAMIALAIQTATLLSMTPRANWYTDESSKRLSSGAKKVLKLGGVGVTNRNRFSVTDITKKIAVKFAEDIKVIKSIKISDNWTYPKVKQTNDRTKLICSGDCSTVVDGKLNISIASDWVDLLDGLTCPTCDGTFKEVLKTEKKPETKKKVTKKKATKKTISEVLVNS